MWVSQSDVEALLGGELSTATVPAAIRQVTVLARAYTRGNGFGIDGEPTDEIAAAITTAAARLASNGSGNQWRKRVDDVEYEYRSSFQGWTLAELAVMNRYRVRVM